MDWELLIRTYPSEKEAIIRAKSLREMVDIAMNGMDIPLLEGPCLEDRLLSFVPDLAHLCSSVWKDYSGSEPPFDMAEVLHAYANKVGIPEIEGVNDDALQVIVTHAFSHQLHLLREKNAQSIPAAWSQGNCPFCGTYPRIGFDTESGRVLHCPMCGHSWLFPRMRCPVCSNEDHTTLGYFEAEGLAGIRVCFCHACKHYIKVMDTKDGASPDPETEDALSLEFDKLALNEGFKEVA
jgi:hypothetical protein